MCFSYGCQCADADPDRGHAPLRGLLFASRTRPLICATNRTFDQITQPQPERMLTHCHFLSFRQEWRQRLPELRPLSAYFNRISISMLDRFRIGERAHPEGRGDGKTFSSASAERRSACRYSGTGSLASAARWRSAVCSGSSSWR